MKQSTPKKCCVEECTGKFYARGWCKNHYSRWQRFGTPTGPIARRKQPPEQRFWSRVKKTSSCWLWVGGKKNSLGYGTFWYQGQNVLAHRFAYELLVGPIPEGMAIDHVRARGCNSTACVNPMHLEVVTIKENNLRGTSPLAKNAKKTHCKHGHPFDKENTFFRKGGGRMCRECHKVRERQTRLRRSQERKARRAKYHESS